MVYGFLKAVQRHKGLFTFEIKAKHWQLKRVKSQGGCGPFTVLCATTPEWGSTLSRRRTDREGMGNKKRVSIGPM